MKNNIIAIMYDFDKTLSTKDMQEYSFIPNLGMNTEEFLDEVNRIKRESKVDPILAYMYMMFKKMKEKNIPLRKEYLREMGKNIELYKGVESWFDRINEYARSKSLEVEHYIISSGSKEIIEGSLIGDKFKEIFASEFYYDENGEAVWPKLAVNYTNKTQFLFRINKGVLDISDDYNLNKKMLDGEKRIATSNMIYIGDGFTDVPCMQLVKQNDGVSIAVYTDETYDKAQDLLNDERINFIAKNDYSEDSELEITVKKSIDRMIIDTELDNKTIMQKEK